MTRKKDYELGRQLGIGNQPYLKIKKDDNGRVRYTIKRGSDEISLNSFAMDYLIKIVNEYNALTDEELNEEC